MMMSDKKSNFLAWLTGIVVLLYIGASMFALYRSQIDWQQFSCVVGPIAGLLLGYLVRGEK